MKNSDGDIFKKLYDRLQERNENRKTAAWKTVMDSPVTGRVRVASCATLETTTVLPLVPVSVAMGVSAALGLYSDEIFGTEFFQENPAAFCLAMPFLALGEEVTHQDHVICGLVCSTDEDCCKPPDLRY